jgi:hypothetical protein
MKSPTVLGVVVNACNPSTLEAEAGGMQLMPALAIQQIQSHPE